MKSPLITVFSALMLLGGLSVSEDAVAAYPEKPVKLTVGFGPGGPSGIAARFMQKRFKAVTGQNLIIINKPGAGGAKAWSQIKGDSPDGYNLTLLNFPHTVLQPIARGKNAGYSYDDILLPLRHTILGVRNRKPNFLILVKPEVLNKIPGFTIAMTNKYKSTHGGKS